MMANDRRAFAPLRPVAAGLVVAGREAGAVRLRTREDVVLVRLVAAALHAFAFLGQRRLLVEVVARPVQVGDVLGDDCTLRVLPWALADAVFRVDRRGTLRAEIRTPGLAAGTHRRCKLLAIPVSA